MALQMCTSFRGAPAPAAYFVVSGINLSRSAERTIIMTDVYYDRAAFVAGTLPLDNGTYVLPYDEMTGNIGEWAHAKLKALPEFASATVVP